MIDNTPSMPATDTERASMIIWLTIAGFCAALTGSFLYLGLRINVASNPMLIAVSLGYAGLAGFYRFSGRDDRIADALVAVGQLFLLLFLGLLLTYAASASGLPYRDVELQALDQWIGFDRALYNRFLASYPAISAVLDAAYLSIQPQTALVPMVLILSGRLHRLQHFTLAFGLALALTAAIAVFIPAVDAFIHVDLGPERFAALPADFYTHLPTLEALRSGRMQAIRLNDLEGLITFPSFHTANAILFAWAVWRIRIVKWIGLVVNGLMIASTPGAGAHYFVDVIAGSLVAGLAIVVAGRLLTARTLPSFQTGSTFSAVKP